MNETEQLKEFIIKYLNLRMMQNNYFKSRSNEILKHCKRAEMNLDGVAQRLMIDMNIDIPITPETPKLF